MRRVRVSITVLILAAASVVLAGSLPSPCFPSPTGQNASSPQEDSRNGKPRKYVDLKSSAGRQTEYGGRKILIATDEFAAHHNGAIITCDSAVRYSDSQLECFGHVLINKGTTYIYGDRAKYDGETNLANVYSQIVKVVDGDATLYTLNFKFNTQTNVGEFNGDGVAIKEDVIIESKDGFYNTKTKDLICVRDVKIRNDRYQMKGDSVVYNLESNKAFFFDNTNIWDTRDTTYLYADRGMVDRDSEMYYITRNGYLLTRTEEAWSDSIDYHKASGYILLRNDFQLDDQKDKLMAFGDWGEYWKERGDVFLTRQPVVLSYDTEQGDSLFMRSDSIFIYTRTPAMDLADSLAKATASSGKSQTAEKSRVSATEEKGLPGSAGTRGSKKDGDGTKPAQPSSMNEDSEVRKAAENTGNAVKEALGVPVAAASSNSASDDASASSQPESKADSARVDTTTSPLDTMTVKERKAYEKKLEKEKRDKEKAEKAKIKADSLKVKLDAIAEKRQAKKTLFLKKIERQDSIRKANADRRHDLKIRKAVEKKMRRGVAILMADSATIARADSILNSYYVGVDTLANKFLDSLLGVYYPRTEQTDSVKVDTVFRDSTYRLVKAYRHVKIFRSDFQAVCDSLAGSTVDSIIHMYKDPVLWNENNQIISEIVHAIIKNQELVRADFEGKPMTISEIDTAHYNQITGKTMSSFFRKNKIYRNDVNSNVQTIYYVQEGDDEEITMMAYVESGDMTAYIDSSRVTGLTYRGNPTYVFYPLNKIPEDRPQRLKGFRWEAGRRPTLDSVMMNRRIRPSLREQKTDMGLPTFDIYDKMERRRKRLVKVGEWQDRTDTLTIETIDWLNSIK